MEFKAKPMFGGSPNFVEGAFKHGDKALYKISGKWDEEVVLNRCDGPKSTHIVFANNKKLHAQRLARRIVPLSDQQPYTEDPQVRCV